MKLPIRRETKNETTRHEATSEMQTRADDVDLLTSAFSRQLEDWPDFFHPFSEAMRRILPLADVEESDDAYTVEIELPGVKRDDVSVELAGRRLVVSGERQEKERVGILRKRTRSIGRFHYEALLPGEVEEDGVEAALNEGVLSVRVPKAASERPRRIQIK